MVKKSDGCTHSPDLHWRHCCVEHDAYYADGSITKVKADLKLGVCIFKAPLPKAKLPIRIYKWVWAKVCCIAYPVVLTIAPESYQRYKGNK